MSQDNPKVLAIIGQGYVGLPLAIAAVEAGWTVIGIDTLSTKVAQINSGSSPVEDVSNETLAKALSKGKYRASTDFAEVKKANVVTICVPTPLDAQKNPDLTLLESATRSIAPHLLEGTLVVSESTSFPGTLREVIIPLIQEQAENQSKQLFYASAPERVNPGDVKWDQKNTPRLLGAINEESLVKACEFYNSICDEVVTVTSPEIAEAAKLLENTFRLVNIALINEFTQLCSNSGIDVSEVIRAAETKPYGFMSFKPGVGVGGHCIPVDPLYLTWWARKNGSQAGIVEKAYEINNEMPKYVGTRALEIVGSIKNVPKVLILGVAYKPGVGDVRETPSSELKKFLISKGAEVFWSDPLVPVWEETFSNPLDDYYDIAILVTAQPGMDLDKLVSNNVHILDCTNTLERSSKVTSL
jgi:UDP-N-acetyl-D-glucosamine dehydrogenase